jgi:hypothetical protein
MTNSRNEISIHVRRFLEENIETVPRLETLLMVHEWSDRNWSIADVASRNYISEQKAIDTFQALLRRRLVPGFRRGQCRQEPHEDVGNSNGNGNAGLTTRRSAICLI